MILTLLSCIFWVASYGSHRYSSYDYLTHSSLEQIPVEIGQDVEIRCIKLLTERIPQSFSYSSSKNAYCMAYRQNCKHQWTKDGELLKNRNIEEPKYVQIRKITYGYCENFNTTTGMVYSIPNMRQVLNMTKDNSEYYQDQCLNSILHIRNIQPSDLGMYQCNFSDHGSYNGKQMGIDPIHNITLVKLQDFKGQPRKLEFFERHYVFRIKSITYLHCVMSGGPIYWFVEVFKSWGYDSYSDEYKKYKIEEIDKLDFWRCFNYTIRTMSPLDDVTESILFIENICTSDSVKIYCSPNENGDVEKNEGNKEGKAMYNKYWNERLNSRYDDVYYDAYYGTIMVCSMPIFAILFIIAFIVACVRAKMCSDTCSCCNYNRNSGYTMVQTVPATQAQTT